MIAFGVAGGQRTALFVLLLDLDEALLNGFLIRHPATEDCAIKMPSVLRDRPIIADDRVLSSMVQNRGVHLVDISMGSK